jgi:hypothetical protein
MFFLFAGRSDNTLAPGRLLYPALMGMVRAP